jgi:divalent metal cation (Fe/Co/Zn/Cd) transporter
LDRAAGGKHTRKTMPEDVVEPFEMNHPAEAADPAAVKRGRRLEYVTLGWNGLEAAVAIAAAIAAGSTSLAGFGIDSLIECLSGSVLLWRLREGEEGRKREHRSLRLVGVSLLALAAYVAYESAESLAIGEAPAASFAGIGLAVAALVAMPLLARAKRRVAADLDSRAMHADSKQSDICAYLAAILLAGLTANALLGWWWADPVAGLCMVPIIGKEGLAAFRGKSCSCAS